MPRYRYELAHYALRERFLLFPKEFFASMSGKRNMAIIQKIIKSIGEIPDAEDTPFTVDEIKVVKHNTDFGKIIFIEMPDPVMVTDAYFVGLVCLNGKKDEIDNYRYFTLELTVDRKGNDGSVFCEWTSQKHINYGSLPGKSLEDFLSAILQKIKFRT